MSRQNTIGTHKTLIRHEGQTTHIRYHQTDVVSFTDTEIILRTGGWNTVTTKTRMNQAARQFNLGYGVSQQKGQWYVSRWNSANHEWYGKVPFNSTGIHHLKRTQGSSTPTISRHDQKKPLDAFTAVSIAEGFCGGEDASEIV